MARPGKPGPPARGIEQFAAEERMTLAVELYNAGMTYQGIADAIGWSTRSVAKRAIDRAIAERGVDARKRAWSRGDELVEESRKAVLTALRFHEEDGTPAPPPLLTAAASVSVSYDRRYGLVPDQYIQVTHSADVKVTVADQLVQRVRRVMDGLDAINLDGVGSGRTPEEQVAALEAIGPVLDVVDAEVVGEVDEDDGYDDLDTSTPDDQPGRWKGGKWIPWWDDNQWHWVNLDDEPDPDPAFFNGPVLSLTQ